MKVAVFSSEDQRPTQLLKGDGSAMFFALLQINTELFTVKVLDDTIYAGAENVGELPTLDELDAVSGGENPDQDDGPNGSQGERAPQRSSSTKRKANRAAVKQRRS